MVRLGIYLSMLVLAFGHLKGQGIYYKYQIVDAAVANAIFLATGGDQWSQKNHWPLPPNPMFGYPSAYGVIFVPGDTLIISYPDPQIDTGIVQMYIRELNLDYNNLTGALPSMAFDSLVRADFSSNPVTGLGSITAPKLDFLDLSGTSVGVLPDGSFPKLRQLRMSGANLSGPLVQLDAPMLEYLDLNYNALTVIDPLDYPNLKELHLDYNQVAGALLPWTTPTLEVLSLYGNNLSGVSSGLEYANLHYLNLADNDISGFLPDWSMPSMRTLLLYGNNFTGPIPEFNFPQMEHFDVRYNDLSGPIPDFSWPNCQIFEASGNQLTGPLPDLYAPQLIIYNLRENKLSGDLQHLDFPELTTLWLDYNLLDGRVAEPLDLPKLTLLQLDGNKLKDTLPILDLQAMQTFSIRFNSFKGGFPDVDMPVLERLHIEGNRFNNLPDYSGSAGFWNLSCNFNFFHFDDLLPYKDIERLEAGAMQPVDMTAEVVGDSILLKVDVGGAGNKYAWIFQGDTIRKDVDSILIDRLQDPEAYQCHITNPAIPDLTLYSKLVESVLPPCWTKGPFRICLEQDGVTWESGDEDNEITTAYPISLNHFIFFEGHFTVDTVSLKVKTDGRFYLKDITLPGGMTGDMTLAEGEYELQLAGEEGQITGFVNDALSTFTPEIGGLEITLDNLQLVGGFNATGVELAFTVSFDNITPSCGEDKEQTTEIKMEGLAITTEGISVNGLEVNDMGFDPSFCLKNLSAAYDQDEDKLTFGLTVLTPFIEVGGGLGFVGGELDSISMKAELQDHIIPIGTTGVGIIGCEGRVSSITDPPWAMKFGGTFRAVVNDDLFRLSTSVEYIPPAELKIEAGEGKLLNVPWFDDWWQIEGGVYGSIDFSTYKTKVGGNVQLLPYLDEDDKKFMGSGTVDVSFMTRDQLTMVGTFEGLLTIPALGDDFPFDWLSAKFGLPYAAGGSGLVVYKSTAKYLVGNVKLGEQIGEVQYRVEFSKRFDDPDFFSLNLVEPPVEDRQAAQFGYRFDIPENTPWAVVKAFHPVQRPVVDLTRPDGTVISEGVPAPDAELDTDPVAYKSFWTVYGPMAGEWSATSDVEADIKVYHATPVRDFAIEASVVAGGIAVRWNPADFMPGDSIDFFADDDTLRFDGAWLCTRDATAGEVIIPDTLYRNWCGFYLQAFAYRGNDLRSAYAKTYLDELPAELAPPADIVVNFDPQSLVIEASWTPYDDPSVAGYVINLVDDDGAQVIGILYSNEQSFTYTLSAFNNQSLVFQTYSVQNDVSCPSPGYELVTTGTEQPGLASDAINPDVMIVYPNPFMQSCTVAIISNSKQKGMLRVFNAQGQCVQNLPVLDILQGRNEVKLDFREMPASQYFVVLHMDDRVIAQKVVLLY